MACPHFKKAKQEAPTDGGGPCHGTCAAHLDRILVPSIDEVSKYCSTERYDECPFYLDYIARCTKADFPKIMVDLKDVEG